MSVLIDATKVQAGILNLKCGVGQTKYGNINKHVSKIVEFSFYGKFQILPNVFGQCAASLPIVLLRCYYQFKVEELTDTPIRLYKAVYKLRPFVIQTRIFS